MGGDIHETGAQGTPPHGAPASRRSEEHTSELQSRRDLVCRLLLEKKKKTKKKTRKIIKIRSKFIKSTHKTTWRNIPDTTIVIFITALFIDRNSHTSPNKAIRR